MHRRGRHPPLSTYGLRSRSTGSGSRSTRPATRRSPSACSTISPARSRHRFGTMRDLVLGVTVVLPDGMRASSGGKVVKNVAGYDLAKLFCGSRGRLGSVERLALRLHPLPAATRTVVTTHRLARAAPFAARAERGRSRRGSHARACSRVRSARSTRRRSRSAATRTSRAVGLAAGAAGGAARARALERGGRAARAAGAARRLRRAGARARVEPARRAGRGGDVQPELIADCVHCGFCLPTCPTYSLWHEEMDSPRGRIYLMQGLVDGSIALSDTVVEHFDRCLGCMACVTSCPSGVQYDRLIEQTRDYVERNHRRGPLDALVRAGVFAVFPHRRRLRAALLLPQAAGAGAARAAEADRAAVVGARVAAGAPAGRRAARRRARRLRRERRLRRRERRNRARAARGGLRRARSARAGLLRRAACARRAARAGRSRVRGRSSATSPATTTSSRTRRAAART